MAVFSLEDFNKFFFLFSFFFGFFNEFKMILNILAEPTIDFSEIFSKYE